MERKKGHQNINACQNKWIVLHAETKATAQNHAGPYKGNKSNKQKFEELRTKMNQSICYNRYGNMENVRSDRKKIGSNGQETELLVDTLMTPITMLPKNSTKTLTLIPLTKLTKKNETEFQGQKCESKIRWPRKKILSVISSRKSFTSLLSLDWFNALTRELRTNQIAALEKTDESADEKEVNRV